MLLGSAAHADGDLAETHGSVLSAEAFDDVDPAIAALGGETLRVRYRSTSDFGNKAPVVSGVLFIPGGTPPVGGWPILAFAHGTSGIREECGPSRSPNLWGSTTMIGAYLRAGYAVAATDYQGLGEPGVHAYLNARDAGWNVIDSVLALRSIRSAKVSRRWVMFGGSQGGGAAWAASELAPSYAPETQLLGTVAMVPAADLVGYAHLAASSQLTETQRAAYVWLIMALSRVHPDMDIDQYRRGFAKANWETLSMCYGPHAEDRNAAVKRLTNEDLKPTATAARQLIGYLSGMALPQRRAQAPMLVIYGGKDEYISADWTRHAIRTACKLGSPIEEDYQPDKGHGTVDVSHALDWLKARQLGQPIRNTCEEMP